MSAKSEALSIVVLTRPVPVANALVRHLSAAAPIRTVFSESPPQPLDAPSFARRAAHLAGQLARGDGRRFRRALERVFTQEELRLPQPAPPIVDTPHRSWADVTLRLEADPPDVIVVFGTSLLPDALCRLARVAALNVHTGLVPYYRGMHCTEFAILHDDLDNAGASVHVVRPRIDAGEIVVQGRPEIGLDDCEVTVDLRIQRLGLHLVTDVVRHLADGRRLSTVPQPADTGALYLGRAFTRGHRRLVRRLVEGGAVRRFVERKRAGRTHERPIVDRIATEEA